MTRPGAIIGTRHRKLPTSGRVGVWGVARAGAVLGAVGWMCMARVVVPPSYTRQVWAQGPAEVLGRACESETCEYTRGRYRIRGLPGVVCGQCRDHLLLAHCVAAQKCRERLARAASAVSVTKTASQKSKGRVRGGRSRAATCIILVVSKLRVAETPSQGTRDLELAVR